MKVTWKRGVVFICALAVVIAAGFYSSDHLLKATDGEENIVEPDAAETADDAEEAAAPEEEQVVAIEQGSFKSGETAEEIAQETAEEIAQEPEEESEEETPEEEQSVAIAYKVDSYPVGYGSQIALTAVLSGYENPVYQWQYNDGSGWKDIDGATEDVYVLTVTEENRSYKWRVDVEEE
jgi:hypothetical protein